MPEPTSAPADPASRRELVLLLTLAAVQFTHVVDFMIMMPLGPQFMRLFDIGPHAFSVLVSAYSFAAAASGFMAAFRIDRYDRRRALLWLYGGFIVATAMCGLATGYGMLLAARVVAGAFGGVLGALILAIVADVVPYTRRASATAIVAASFSLAAVMGLPLGLWLAELATWRAPFLTLALLSVLIAVVAARLLPPLTIHLDSAQHRRAFAQLRAVFGVPNHLRAFTFILSLMLAGFTVIPFVAPYMVANVGIAEPDLAAMYFAGGAATLVSSPLIGRWADRAGKRHVFKRVALASLVPILLLTHLPPLSLAAMLPVSVLFFILVPGRFGPAMALVSGSAVPQLRGSFMTFVAAIQQGGAGLAAVLAGVIVGRAPDGTLTDYGAVGWIAAAFTLACIALAARVRVVDGEVAPAKR